MERGCMISLRTGAAGGISSSLWRGSGLSERPDSWGSLRVWMGTPRRSCCLVLCLPSWQKPLPAWPSGDLPLACCPFPWQEWPCPGGAFTKFNSAWAGKKPQVHPACEENFHRATKGRKNGGVALSGLRVLSSCQHRLQWDGLDDTSGD